MRHRQGPAIRARGALALVGLLLCRCMGGGTTPEALGEYAELQLLCQGNEPFWVLAIDGRLVTYRALAEPDRERRFEGAALARRGHQGPTFYEWRGAEEGSGERNLVVRLVEETCLDTMSDETPPFEYRVWVDLPDGGVVAGCCRRQPAG